MLTIGAGCARDQGRGLLDPDPLYRIPAMKQAAEHQDPQALSLLVDNLSSEDPAIRFYAIQSLQHIAGQTFDYHYFDDADERAPAIDKWRAWLKEKQQP